MRDTKALRPDLQYKLSQLIALCQKNNITIGIGECVRTVAEQNALYAKGRTEPGAKVTNAPGTSYSSQHQWGVAVDFYLKMDIDGDGQIADDAFNNSKKTFNKVGSLAKSIGLGWGGDWKSPVDMPHLYLPDWGSTTAKLKSQYGTPDKFFKTWNGTVDQKAKGEQVAKNKTDSPQAMDKKYSKSYFVKAECNLMSGAGTKKNVINILPKGAKVICYGYYTMKNDKAWLYVQYGKYVGFVQNGKLKAL